MSPGGSWPGRKRRSRRLLDTTNTELNAMAAEISGLRKPSAASGMAAAFPAGSTPAVTSLMLYLAVRNLQDYRNANTGIRSSRWKQALQALTIYFDGRIPSP